MSDEEIQRIYDERSLAWKKELRERRKAEKLAEKNGTVSRTSLRTAVQRREGNSKRR